MVSWILKSDIFFVYLQSSLIIRLFFVIYPIINNGYSIFLK